MSDVSPSGSPERKPLESQQTRSSSPSRSFDVVKASLNVSGAGNSLEIERPRSALATSDSSHRLPDPRLQEEMRPRSAPGPEELEKNRGALRAESRDESVSPQPDSASPKPSLPTSGSPHDSSLQLPNPGLWEGKRPSSASGLESRGGLRAESGSDEPVPLRPSSASGLESRGRRDEPVPLRLGFTLPEVFLVTSDGSHEALEPESQERGQLEPAPKLGSDEGGLQAESGSDEPVPLRPGSVQPEVFFVTSDSSLDPGPWKGERSRSAPAELHQDPLEGVRRFQSFKAGSIAKFREKEVQLDKEISPITSQCDEARTQLDSVEEELRKSEGKKRELEDEISVAYESEYDDLEKQISQKRQENGKLEEERKKQEENIRNSTVTLAELQQRKEKLETDRGESENELDALQKYKKLEKEIGESENELAELQQRKENLEAELRKRENELDTELPQRKENLEAELRKRENELAELQQRKKDLDKLAELQQRKEDLERNKSERNKLLEKLPSEIENLRRKINLLEKNNEYIRQLGKESDMRSIFEQISIMAAYGIESNKNSENLRTIAGLEMHRGGFESGRSLSGAVDFYIEGINSMISNYKLDNKCNKIELREEQEIRGMGKEVITDDTYRDAIMKSNNLIDKYNDKEEEIRNQYHELEADTGRERQEDAIGLIVKFREKLVLASKIANLSQSLIEYSEAVSGALCKEMSLSGTDIPKMINTRFKRGTADQKKLSRKRKVRIEVVNKDIAEKESDIKKLEAEISKIENKIPEIEDEISKLRKKIPEIENEEMLIQSVEDTTKKISKEIKDTEEEIKEKHDKIEKLRSRLGRVQNEHSDKEKSIAKLKMKKKKIILGEENIDNLQKNIEDLDNGIREVDQEISNIRGNIRESENSISRIDSEHEENAEEISRLGEEQLKIKKKQDNALSNQKQYSTIILAIEKLRVKGEEFDALIGKLLAERDSLMAALEKCHEVIMRLHRCSFEDYKRAPRTTEGGLSLVGFLEQEDK